MSVTNLFLADLRNKARRKGTTLEELCAESDPASTGRMHIAVFRKLVANTGLYIEEEKFLDVTETHCQNAQFFYRQWMADVDGSGGRADSVLSDDQLREFGAPLRDRGVDLIDFLRQYDRARSGSVTTAIFLRNIGSSPICQTVCRAYTNAVTREVEYTRMAEDVNRVLAERFVAGEIDPSKVQKMVVELSFLFRRNGKDPFQEFQIMDKMKRRRIQPAQFVNVARGLGAEWSEGDMQMLTSAFTENAVFDYVTLCNELERCVRLAQARPAAPEPVRVNLDDILVRLRKEISDRRSNIRSQVRELDPSGTGVAPIQRFTRLLVNGGFSLSEIELSALERAFGDGRGGFVYSELFDHVIQQAKPTVQIESVMVRLQDHLQAKRIQMKPKLQKYDPRGSGIVPFAKILATLREVEFDMTSDEHQVFSVAFCHGREETTGIEELCGLVDPIMEAPKPEPMIQRQQYVDPAAVVLEVMTKVAVQIQKYQLSLMSDFSAHDTRRVGTIPVTAFVDILMMLPIPPTKQEMDVLVDFYRSSANKEMNYESFCSELDEFAATRIRQNPDIVTKVMADPAVPARTGALIEPILRKIKVALVASKTSAETLFAPYDTGRSWVIPETRLQPILEDFGLHISSSEVSTLLGQFQDQRLPEKFNYKAFCQTLNSIELTHADLTAQPEVVRPVSGQALRFCGEFREKLMARRKKIRTPFMGVTAQGMSASDFRRCVDSFGLVVKETDMQMLLREYRLNMQGDVDWQKFCCDVESNKTV